MDIAALQQQLRRFAAEREWQPFHTPKNLATALMVEAAELAEIFQWLTPEQSREVEGDAITRARVGDECADVLLYLLQLADQAGVDLEQAAAAKLARNATRFPPSRPGLPGAARIGPAPKTHVLVDWENVQPDDAELRKLAPEATDVWIFHGPLQRHVGEGYESFGEHVTRIPISRPGKNSLDFHLAFYAGYLAARYPGARFVVVSNDQGYAPMLEHAVGLAFSARLAGFDNGRGRGRVARQAAPVSPKPPAAKSAVKKAVKKAVKAAAKKTLPPEEPKPAVKRAAAKAAVKAAAKVPAKVPAEAPARTPAKASARAPSKSPGGVPAKPSSVPKDALLHVRKALGKVALESRPTKRSSLLKAIASWIGAAPGDAQTLDVFAALVADGTIAPVGATGVASSAKERSQI